MGDAVLPNGLILKNVLVVPQFKHNLLSIYTLARDNNCQVQFNTNGCEIIDSATKRIQAMGTLSGGLYYLQNNTAMANTCSQGEQVPTKTSTGQSLEFQKWHLRLGHAAATTMQHIEAIKKCITKFEGEFVMTAAYLINRLPTQALKHKIPYEILYNEPVAYDNLRAFGCLSLASNPNHNSDKFEVRSVPCIMVGYPINRKGYRLLNLSNMQIFVTRDALFHESIFPLNPNTPKPYLLPNPCVLPTATTHIESDDIFVDESDDHVTYTADSFTPDIPNSSTNPDTLPPVLRKSTKNTKQPSWLQQYVHTLPDKANITQIADHFIHPQFQCFLASLTSTADPTTFKQAVQSIPWVEAMNKELTALEDNGTWEITTLPPNKKAIGCKWIFKTKYNPDGTVERHKARLVVLGCKQVYGVDYMDTFAPVAKLTTVRTLLAVAAIQDWITIHIDVTNAFLRGDLHDTVFMKLPQGNSPTTISDLKLLLSTSFHLKDLGNVRKKYTLDLLQEFGMMSTTPVKIPMDIHLKLDPTKADVLPDPHPCQRLLGKLIYLTVTRPDIIFSVHVLSQYMHQPTNVHMQAAKHVLRYLVANPAQEVEYRAMALTACEITWLAALLKDMGLKDLPPAMLKCDNMAAISIAANPVLHERTKHVEIDCHFIREKINSGSINTHYMPSHSHLADIMTKTLPVKQHHKLLTKLGASGSPSAPLEGDGNDNMLPSKDEAQRLSTSLRNSKICYFKDNGHTVLLGEVYKLFWPDLPEFVRMAAKFGITIVPFGVVGEDDIAEVVLDYNDYMRILVISDLIKKSNDEGIRLRTDMGGEIANQDLYFPDLLPKIPGRFYFLFGKPIETKGQESVLKNRVSANELYLQIKSEVEDNIAYLLKKRKEDPYRNIVDRTIYRAFDTSIDEAPSFEV
ncbi:hypothetical protein AgCh_000231 [Apium graveolens]